MGLAAKKSHYFRILSRNVRIACEHSTFLPCECLAFCNRIDTASLTIYRLLDRLPSNDFLPEFQ
eukprot:240945-Pleurochrysis_carterae.AAC.3